jgi:hypothetical protein
MLDFLRHSETLPTVAVARPQLPALCGLPQMHSVSYHFYFPYWLATYKCSPIVLSKDPICAVAKP